MLIYPSSCNSFVRAITFWFRLSAFYSDKSHHPHINFDPECLWKIVHAVLLLLFCRWWSSFVSNVKFKRVSNINTERIEILNLIDWLMKIHSIYMLSFLKNETLILLNGHRIGFAWMRRLGSRCALSPTDSFVISEERQWINRSDNSHRTERDFSSGNPTTITFWVLRKAIRTLVLSANRSFPLWFESCQRRAVIEDVLNFKRSRKFYQTNKSGSLSASSIGETLKNSFFSESPPLNATKGDS